MKSEYIWNPLYVKVMNILEVYKGTSKKFEEICKEVDKKFLEYINVVQYGNLCLFKYSQFNEAIYTIEYVKEARSVVIDIETGELIMCPFKKFFNVNEYEESKESEVERLISQADKIEFSDKLDGSFQQARWKNGIFYYISFIKSN